jgi:ABC-type sugar transport systems, permease components
MSVFRHKQSALMRREAMVGIGFLMPAFLGCAVFVLIPFGQSLLLSFFNASTGAFEGVKHYRDIFTNKSFQQALLNTGRFMGLCVPMLIVFSLLLALGLTGKVVGRGALRAAFLLPMAIPVASVALLWQLLFHQNGLFNALFSNLGLNTVDWMRTDAALICLIISYLWKNIGYNMVLFIAALGAISPSLYEAAAVDGAGKMRTFFSITLPCLKPALFTVTILSVLNSFRAYREAYLVAGNYPHGSIYLLQHTLNNWFAAIEIERLSAAAVTTSIIILILVGLLKGAWASDKEGGTV